MTTKEQRIEDALTLMGRHEWEPTFKPVLAAALPRMQLDIEPDHSSLEFLRKLREPGPRPPDVEGVSWSRVTIPNMAGDHHIPIRIYRPERPNPLKPSYVLYHGGGLCMGHLNSEHQRCIELTKTCGAVGFSVDFRMAPENPPEVILGDCYSALKYVTDHAVELYIDPRRIVITGSSGGGMATLAIAQMARDRGDTAPLMQIALYPTIDDRKLPEYVSMNTDYAPIKNEVLEALNDNLKKHGKDKPYIFPSRTVDVKELCPAVLIVPQNAAIRDPVILYASRLMQADVPTALHVLPGVAHGFDLLAPNCDSTKTAYKLMTDAFKRAAAAVQD